MGVNLRELVKPVKVEIELENLNGKVIAIDAYNMLYQFLAIIRQRDGKPLIDAYGRITSHLNGLFYRTINFLEAGLKPVYVYDGKPPEVKIEEIKKRMKIKELAQKKYEEALARGDLEEARIYAQQTSLLTKDMVEDSKKLLTYLGIPWVQAPSEGEAQAAYMVKKGDAWATASQDYDSLLFGTPRLVRNLAITGRRKLPRKNIYIEVKPELIELKKLLDHYSITREQLIYIGILLGTDYNPEGVKGVGIKTALKLVTELKDLDKILKALKNPAFLVDPHEIVKLFLEPEVTNDYKLEWSAPNKEKVMEFLCEEHSFSEKRVENALERAEKAYKKNFAQSTIEAWFS